MLIAVGVNWEGRQNRLAVELGQGKANFNEINWGWPLDTFVLDRGCPLEYIIEMHTVVELPSYLKKAEALFRDEERAEIVTMVSSDPKCGDVIQGTGGFRKVRVGRGGMGKRGGARVVYILRNENYPVFLVSAYAKNEKENLTKAERNELARMSDAIFEKYGR